MLIDILIENSSPVGGFQFSLTGASIISASGGVMRNGFTLSNSPDTVPVFFDRWIYTFRTRCFN